ncbi:MAG: hypothetical protein WC533_02715 [Candidatus Pacearchaeota archaeon]
MFKKKCIKCGKKIGRKYEFCPYCGFNSNFSYDSERDYGFLGKENLNELGIKLPPGFNMLFKPLMKELNKQMVELNKELGEEDKLARKNSKPVRTSFSIHIGMPGAKPIVLEGMNSNLKFANRERTESKNKKVLKLPKIKSEILSKVKKLPRAEPQTSVRRLADRVIYELILKGVKSEDSLNITALEEGVEVKAFSDKEMFVKTVESGLKFADYSFAPEKLILEFKL